MRCGLQGLAANPSGTPFTKRDSGRNEEKVVNLLSKLPRKLQERTVWLRNNRRIVACLPFHSGPLLLLLLLVVVVLFGGHGAGFKYRRVTVYQSFV